MQAQRPIQTLRLRFSEFEIWAFGLASPVKTRRYRDKIVYAVYEIIKALSQAFRDLENWASKHTHYTISIKKVKDMLLFRLALKKFVMYYILVKVWPWAKDGNGLQCNGFC